METRTRSGARQAYEKRFSAQKENGSKTTTKETAMSKEFDPDQPFVKKRSMTGVTYEQDGCKFNSGYKYISKLKADKPAAETKPKDDARESARKKISKKRGKKSPKPGLDERMVQMDVPRR